jgi:hypothetical protein
MGRKLSNHCVYIAHGSASFRHVGAHSVCLIKCEFADEHRTRLVYFHY